MVVVVVVVVLVYVRVFVTAAMVGMVVVVVVVVTVNVLLVVEPARALMFVEMCFARAYLGCSDLASVRTVKASKL